MKFQDFPDQMQRYRSLRRLVLAFVQYQSLILGQVAACNRLHGVEGRLARWLLMTDDRTHQDQLPLSQEFLSQMLGTRRSTITITAIELQDQGIIDYSRGNVRILDREKLKRRACECYQVTDEVLQRFLKLPLETEYSRAM